MYIMNVDWDWAKQRPHYIAEQLSGIYDVVVVYPYAWRRKNLVRNGREGVRLSPFFRFPLGGRFELIRTLNEYALRMMARVLIWWCRPDMVWVSSPELYACLPKSLPGKLIYDCMDDVLAFPSNSSRSEALAAQEKALVEASSFVFCSSGNLLDKLSARTGLAEKCSVVYNALEPAAFLPLPLESQGGQKSGSKYVLGYIGTISSWFDFDALVKIVDAFPAIEIHVIGPVENLGGSMPRHVRIKNLGPVRHSELHRLADRFDALIMPFIVTELVLSVDPVKLYEYIFFNKPIISVEYPEIEKFGDFVDFYTDHQSLLSVVGTYVDGGFRKKYSDSDRERFIASNTWSDRIRLIQGRLEAAGI